jgi:hypothetical protein
LKKGAPKTFLLVFAGQSFLWNFVLFSMSPALQASLGRDMKNKTHSPAGECDRPENTFCNSVLGIQIFYKLGQTISLLYLSEDADKTE